MRQGQHNKRARGRGRKPQNPSNRTYDSNGPDVKIRGTASHVAEKYLSLARDSQVSGDPISSENYMQHAEHYIRIIAAAQANAPQQTQQTQQSMQEASVNGGGGTDSHGGQMVPTEQSDESFQAVENDQPSVNGDAGDSARTDGDSDSRSESKPRRQRTRRPRPNVVAVESDAADAKPESAAVAEAVEPVVSPVVSKAPETAASEEPSGSSDDNPDEDKPVIAEAG